MSTITSQIVHLASDAYGDHLATVGGSPSNGDELDAMRAALEVAEAAWKKSLPEHQTEMKQAREVLNRVIIPDAAPVEAVNKAISEIVEGLAKIVNLPVDDQERIAREPLMGLVVFIRDAWQVVAQSHRALAYPRPRVEQAGEIVPMRQTLPIDSWEAIARNSVRLMTNARDGHYSLDEAIDYLVGALKTGRDVQPHPVGVSDGWLSNPDSIPTAVIDACRDAIRIEFGDNGTDGYYKRILAKVFAAMVATSVGVKS